MYLTLKSADVCHSYWVPRLAGKVDLIPGRINSLTLQTSEPGLFLGQCAEYCGAQHANMLIRVIVDSPADFERWLENQSPAAVEDPSARDGKQVFLTQSCVNCHACAAHPPRHLRTGPDSPDEPQNARLGHHSEHARKPCGLGSRSANDQTRLPDAGVWPEQARSEIDREYLLTLR